MLSSIVTIIAIATVVHLIVHFRELRAGGMSPREALARTGSDLAAPIFWACATDAAGFGSLIAAEVEPVHDFGWMMLIGSLVVLPALVAVVPCLALAGRWDSDPRRAWGEGRLELGLDRLSRWIEQHPGRLWGITAILTISAAIGCARLEVETDFTKNFRATSRVVRSYEFVERHLGGAGVWDILIPAPAEIDWDFLRRLSEFERELREIRVGGNFDNESDGDLATGETRSREPGLTKVLSIADAVEAATLGNLSLIPLPALRDRAVREALAQMEAQMPEFYGALVTRDPRDPDRKLIRVMLRSRERQESAAKQRLIANVQQASRTAFGETEVTGFFVLLTNLIQSTTRDQWLTFALSTGGILLMMLCAFRSPVLAVVAIVPNTLPVFMVSGLLGWLGLKINMGSAMIAAASMGLSVDSSAHYITAYRELRAKGLSVHAALAAANQSVGRAMVFSTFALVVGFTALCWSEFVPTIYFGALMGLTMVGGMFGNLVVLPLLLAAVHRDLVQRDRVQRDGDSQPPPPLVR
jgi:predicted RND superfamily exporter protein